MCDFFPFKIVTKNFFINISNNNNKFYQENKFLINRNKKSINIIKNLDNKIKYLDNEIKNLNKNLFEINKNKLDYDYIIEGNKNYIDYLENIIFTIKKKLKININQDEINEINALIDSLVN